LPFAVVPKGVLVNVAAAAVVAVTSKQMHVASGRKTRASNVLSGNGQAS